MNLLPVFTIVFSWSFSFALKDELGTSDKVTGRTFVEFNPVLPLGFGLQVTVPLSFFIPHWAMLGTHGRSFTSNVLRHAQINRRRQSANSNCPSQVTSLEDYLDMLQIDTEVCQQRFICEISSNPKKFQPLSDILLKKLVYNDTRQTGNVVTNVLQTHWLSRAATLGAQSEGRKCSIYFRKCTTEAESVLDMGLLGWWQLLASIFQIHVIGETNNNWYS